MTAPKLAAAAQHATAAANLDLQRLRSMRNAVIGSRTRKSELVAQGKVPELVALLVSSSVNDEVRSLAATIIGSLAHAAPPPTLLSLCRARATEALFCSLEDLSARMSKVGIDFEEGQDYKSSSSFAKHLRLLETFLRSLRAVLMAFSDEVSPSTKWERGLGLGIKTTGVGSASSSFSSAGKSAREVVGWQMAHAGFEAPTGTQKAGWLSFDGSPQTSLFSDMTPHGELMILARQAICDAFQPDRLRLWLGALFIAKLPIAAKKLPTSRPASGATSRASTRPASPAILQASSAFQAHSRSSSVSLGPEASMSSGSRTLVPAQPTSTSQVRILAIVEMVAGTLSACLSIAYQPPDLDPMLAGSTPAEVLAQRRNAVLAFRAEDGPYWNGYGVNKANDADDERGRHFADRTSSSQHSDLQGAFVKRGKSIDGRGMDAEAQADAVQHRRAEQAPVSDDDSTPYLASDTSVLQILLQAVECGYAKAQEAALWALTDLARDNAETSRSLFNCPTSSGQVPTTMLLGMRKDPAVSVRLAAFCCLAHIIKAHPFTTRTNECVLSVLVDLMSVTGEVQVAATFAFARLVADSSELQALACERYESVEKLGALLVQSKPKVVEASDLEAMDVDDAYKAPAIDGMTERLREASLMALAALCFQRDDIRRRLVDITSPPLLPIIVASMSAPQVATRVAACRLVRALSRSISILRTSLVDAGVSGRLLSILQDEGEDAHVRNEAICTICNLSLKFSPMKQAIIDNGGMTMLIKIAKSTGDGMQKLNALFAIKNILYASDSILKRRVMEDVGWDFIQEQALHASDEQIQEQAISIIRNICQNTPEDIDLTLKGFEGGDNFLTFVEEIIWQQRNEDILVQAAFVIVNMASGSDEHRRMIVNRPNILDALVFFLNHAHTELRVAGIWAATNLTQPIRVGQAHSLTTKTGSSNVGDVIQDAISRLRSFGFDKRLRELVEDTERDVSDRARGLMVRFDSM